MIAVADFNSTAVALLVAGGAVGTLFAVVFAIRFATSFPALPVPGPETSDLGPEPPAVANLLVNRCNVTRAAEAATLVDLAARRHLDLFEAGPDHFVVRVRADHPDALTPYEEQVLDLVRTKATGGSAPLAAIQLDDREASDWHSRFAKNVVRDAKSRGLLRRRWSRLDWLLFGVLAAAALLLVAGGLYAAHVENTHPAAASRSGSFHRGDWFWVAAGAWVVLLVLIGLVRSIRYSASGKSVASRWLGVRRFLRQDSNLGDAPPAAVAIWNRLLSYGAALGVARATAAAIPLAVEDRATAWSRYGGDWHQLHIEYPRRFGYGQRPLSIFLGGLVRTLFWGALAFAALPVTADALWTVGRDQLNKTTVSNAETTAIVAAFFAVFGVIGVGLLVQFADGLIRLWRGGSDLARTRSVEGAVVKVVEDQGSWFAVDPGHVDHVKAWHPGDAAMPPRGATVRVSLTPHLRHVKKVDVLAGATPPSPSLASPAPTAAGSPISAGTWSAPVHPVALDAAAVAACAGMSLPEVDPASIAGSQHIPPNATVRAFSDGASRILIAAVPEGAGMPSAAAPRGLADRLPEGTAQGRWSQDRVLMQLVPAALIVIDVELAGRSSSDREHIARVLAARLASAPPATATPGSAPPSPPETPDR